MKKNLLERLHAEIKKAMPNSNSMIIAADEETGINMSMNGYPAEIARCMFSMMMSDNKSDLQKDLFSMVADIIYNVARMSPEKTMVIEAALKQGKEDAIEPETTTEDKSVPLLVHGEA